MVGNNIILARDIEMKNVRLNIAKYFLLTFLFTGGFCYSAEDLYSLIKNGDDAEGATRLLQGAPDLVNKTNELGDTPLFYAALFGRINIAKVLIQFNADVDIRNLKRQSALHYAATQGHMNMVKLLLDQGSHQFLDQDDLFPSHCAILARAPQVAELLLPAKGAPFDLCLAAYAGKLELAKSFLKSIPTSIKKTKGGWTPLHFALAGKANLEVVRLLINNGADVNEPYPGGSTILNYVIHRGSLELVKELLEAKVDLQSKVSPTPLYLAIRDRQLEIAKLLLENHCDPNQVSFEDRYTPLFIACFENNLAGVKLLVSNGASIDLVCNRNGDTPLMIAVQRDNLGMLEYLLDKGADVKIRNSWGETALHVYARCARGDSARCGEKLVTLVDVNSVDGAGNTPLINAVRADCPAMVKCLLKSKADPLIAAQDGLTPLVLAKQLGNDDVLQLLKSDQK